MSSLQQDLETLRAVKPLLLNVLNEARTNSSSPAQARQLPPAVAEIFDRLTRKGEEEFEAWYEQVATEDPDLAQVILDLLSAPPHPWVEEASVFRFTERITDVKFSSHLSFEIEDPRPIIRLIFLSGEDSDKLALTSDQDLEDTLHIGKSVCGSITETLHLMHEHRIPLRRDQFGESFGEVLSELEEVVQSLRRFYDRAEEPSPTIPES